MAEILCAYYLPVGGGVTGGTKRERLRQILSWSSRPVVLPDDLAEALDHGIGGGGVGLHTFKWASISYLVRFAISWKGLSTRMAQPALAEPWAYLSIADRAPTTGGGTYAKEALLHLVHPDAF